MYKLIIKDKQYVFYKHYNTGGYKKVYATTDQFKLVNYIEKELPDTNIGTRENMANQVSEAIIEMIQLNNNVSEFGVRGYYTVSYPMKLSVE